MIEMVIVVVILAILVAICVPALNSAIRDSKVDQARATIKSMGDAYYRTFLLEEFERIPEDSAGTVFVGDTPKEQVENAAQFYYDNGLLSQLADTRYVIVLGGQFMIDEDALGFTP